MGNIQCIQSIQCIQCDLASTTSLLDWPEREVKTMIQRMTRESTRQDKKRSDMHCYILLLFLCFYAEGRAGNNGLSRSEGSTLLGKPAALSSWWPAECGIIFFPRATSRYRPFNCLWGGRSTASATAPPPHLLLLTHLRMLRFQPGRIRSLLAWVSYQVPVGRLWRVIRDAITRDESARYVLEMF